MYIFFLGLIFVLFLQDHQTRIVICTCTFRGQYSLACELGSLCRYDFTSASLQDSPFCTSFVDGFAAACTFNLASWRPIFLVSAFALVDCSLSWLEGGKNKKVHCLICTVTFTYILRKIEAPTRGGIMQNLNIGIYSLPMIFQTIWP